MKSKIESIACRGVKKSGGKAADGGARLRRPLLAKSSSLGDANAFLRQRLGKKVRELREPVLPEEDDCDDMMVTTSQREEAITNLAELQAEAERRVNDFERQDGCAQGDARFEEEQVEVIGVCREAENSRKRFYTELRRVLASADIVVEVLDARDPGQCRCTELEAQVTSAGKRLVLLLNKIDLVPKHATEAWKKHLQRSFPTIAFKAARNGAQRPMHAATSAERAPDGLLRSTHCVVGADELMQLLKNYSRTGGSRNKAHISVGVVGYPNTGKSSVINSMKRHTSVDVGGKAGVTKHMQEVPLDKKVTLIDSPGIVFEGASSDPSVVLRNVVRVENVDDPVGVVEALVAKSPREALLQFYGLPAGFASTSEFLVHVAQARGKLRRGSGLDLVAAAKSVISDWTTGRFRYYTLPPVAPERAAAAAEEVMETAEVVSTLAPALDLEALLASGGDMPTVLGAPPTPPDEDVDAGGDAAMGGAVEGAVKVDMESIRC